MKDIIVGLGEAFGTFFPTARSWAELLPTSPTMPASSASTPWQ